MEAWYPVRGYLAWFSLNVSTQIGGFLNNTPHLYLPQNLHHGIME